MSIVLVLHDPYNFCYYILWGFLFLMAIGTQRVHVAIWGILGP